MNKMKVMIGYPPFSGKGSPMLTQNRQFQWYSVASFIYPVVSASAATLLAKAGFTVKWLDGIAQGLSMEKFLEITNQFSPNIIALETKTPVIRRHWNLINNLKQHLPETQIVLMGDHVTALPAESMGESRADFVITGGNYDLSLLGIAEYLCAKKDLPKGIWYRKNGEIRDTGDFELTYDLNKLPFVDRVLTDAHLYGEKWKKRTPFFYTMAGRDCYWAKCTFCAWTVTHPIFRVRKTENLLDEIGFLIEHHKAKEIFDDTGTFPGGNWLEKFCKGMIDRGFNNEILFSCNMRFDQMKPEVLKLMKKAGFRKVKAGLESANQGTLDRIKKGIKVEDIVEGCKNAARVGIDVQLTVIVGYPWETRDDAQRTLDLARNLMDNGYAEMLQATVLVPYPGTPLYKYGVENNLFRFDANEYDRFDMTEPVFKTPDMDPEEVLKMCNGLYKSFFSPKFAIRQVSRIRSWEDVKYIAKGIKAVSGHLKDFMKIRS